MFQEIPRNPLSTPKMYQKLHTVSRIGQKNTNWRTKTQQYIDIWESRHAHQANGQMANSLIATREYKSWFAAHTVIHITNPIQENVHGYQNRGVLWRS